MTAIPLRPNHMQKTRHTYECLVERLKDLEPILYRRFSVYAADCGMDAARRAGHRYIERAEAGHDCDLENAEAYLRVIAFRAACRAKKRELDRLSIDRVVTVTTTETASEPHDDNNPVWSALLALPPRQQEAVVLHVVNGLTVSETAREMKITHQTVRHYLESALNCLKKQLSGDEKNDPSRCGQPLLIM